MTPIPGIIADSVLGGPFAAPMFMICMGIGICYFRKQHPGHFFVRGIRLLVLGCALNIFQYGVPQIVVCLIHSDQIIWDSMLCSLMEVDILQFAGAAFLVIGLSKKAGLSNYLLFGISVIISVFGVLLKNIGTGILLPDLLPGLFWETQQHTYFTLFHWFIFSAFGLIFGEQLQKCTDKAGAYKKLILLTLPIGLDAKHVQSYSE